MNMLATINDATSLPSLITRAGRPMSARSVVYFASANGLVKIGYTTDLTKRLSAIGTGAGVQPQVLRIVEGGRPTERWLHKRFAKQRVYGEWFQFHPDMIAVVPPDEIVVRPQVVERRDVHLTIRERLRAAQANGQEVGISDRLILASFVAALDDNEASAVMELVADRADTITAPNPKEAA